MEDGMRALIGFGGLAGALAFGGILALSAPVHAQEWCGYQQRTGARVHCGYSSRQVCEQALSGKTEKTDKKTKKTDATVICKPDPSVG